MFLIIVFASVFASSLSYSFLFILLPDAGLEPALIGYEPTVLASYTNLELRSAGVEPTISDL